MQMKISKTDFLYITTVFTIVFILSSFVVIEIANADTITCYFENYAGDHVKCSDRQPFTTNYPYLIEDKGTHYKITNDADVCKLPKKPWLDYSFTPNKIGMSATIPSISSVSDRLVKHNDSVYYLTITNMSSAVRKCGKMIWDDGLTIIDNGTLTGETDEDGIEIRNYSYLPENKAQFKVVNNQLRLYVYKQWFTQTAQFPITINMDSWVLNSTAGWNGTFTQTNTDENESIMINWNHSTFEPYISYWTMDSFNSTVIFDENTTSSNNGTITSATDAVGWRNRSRSFDGVNNYVSFSTIDTFTINNSHTASAWFKINSLDSDQTIINHDITTNTSGIMFKTSTGKIHAGVYNGITYGNRKASSNDNITMGIWYHVVYVYTKPNTLSLYINSKLQSGTSSPFLDTGTGFRIGKGTSGNRPLNGSIDEVKIFNRSLSASEVSALYNDSYYATGNFTTVKRDWGGENIFVNMSFSGTVPTGTSVNIYQNHSNDDLNWNLVLIQANAQPNTNYTPTNQDRYDYYIFELNTSASATPHISQIELYETDRAPTINVTSPTNTTYSITNQVPLNVIADETINTWIYNIGAGNVTFTPNTTILFIPNGTHQLYVWANDTSGNWGVNDSIWFTINVPSQGLQFGSLAVIALQGDILPVIEDNNIDLSIPKRPVANPPAEGTEDGFPTLDFDDGTDESVFIMFHLPHTYADGGQIHMHVDAFVDTAPTNPENAVWALEYKKQSHEDNFDFSTGTSTVNCTHPVPTGSPGNDKKIQESDQLVLNTTGFIAHDIILMRLFRDANNPVDDFTGDVRLMHIHIEFLIDKLGEPT